MTSALPPTAAWSLPGTKTATTSCASILPDRLLRTIRAAISSVTDDSELDTHVAVDGLGNIYALGTFNNAVFKFSPDGKFMTRFGDAGDQPGQFRAPSAIAVDGKGRVYVSDFKGVQVFDSNGRYLAVFKPQAQPRAWFSMTMMSCLSQLAIT